MIHVSFHFTKAISITGLFHAVAIEILATKNIKWIKAWVCHGTFSTGLFSRAILASLVILTIITKKINE